MCEDEDAKECLIRVIIVHGKGKAGEAVFGAFPVSKPLHLWPPCPKGPCREGREHRVAHMIPREMRGLPTGCLRSRAGRPRTESGRGPLRKRCPRLHQRTRQRHRGGRMPTRRREGNPHRRCPPGRQLTVGLPGLRGYRRARIQLSTPSCNLTESNSTTCR